MIPVFTRSLIPQNNAIVKADRTPTSDLFFLLKSHHDRTGGDSGLIEKIENGIQATGASQATAYQLSKDVSEVTAGAGGGVILFNVQPSQVMEVFNGTGGSINVYPPVGGKIGGGATNTPYVLAAGALQRFRCYSQISGAAAFRALILIGAGSNETSFPRTAQALGYTFVPSGNTQVVLPAFSVFVRYGFGALWVPVGNSNPPVMARIDTTTGKITDQIPIAPSGGGFDPLHLCMSDKAIWFTDIAGGRIGSVDPVTHAVTFPPGLSGLNSPRGICWDGQFLWATLSPLAGLGSLIKIDPGAGTILQTIPVGLVPFYPAIDGYGFIWVPNFNDPSCTIVRASDGAVIKTIVTNPGPWICFSDGLYMWIPEDAGAGVASTIAFRSITFDNGLGGTNINGRYNLPVNSGVHDCIRVGHAIYVVMSGLNGVIAIDADTGATIRTISTPSGLGGDPASIEWDGRDLWVLSALDQKLTRLRENAERFS